MTGVITVSGLLARGVVDGVCTPPDTQTTPRQDAKLSAVRSSRMTSPTGSLSDLVTIESTHVETGAAQAKEVGRITGTADGRELGWTAGAAVAAELSFYAGGAAALAELPLAPRAVAAAGRAAAAATQLLVQEIGNSADADFDAALTLARNAFREATALAGIPSVRWDAGKRSRAGDYSF